MLLAAAGWAPGSIGCGPALAAQAVSRPSVAADGTLHTAPLDIPPSELWSAQFRKWYAQYAVYSFAHPGFPIPARNAPPSAWARFRAWDDGQMAVPLAWDRKHYAVHIENTTLAGVHVGIITPAGGLSPENAHRVLMDLRGGGFVLNPGLHFGELESIPVASLGRIKVITLDYRQAPRYAYPAATEDVAAVYKELLRHHDPGEIGIYGCSAGGFLTAQAVAWFQSRGLPRPGAVGILCATPGPATAGSLSLSGDSRIWGGVVPRTVTAPISFKDSPLNWYMASADIHDPRAYPGISSAVLAKFPPTLFLTGTRDPGSSAVFVSYDRMLRLGVDASLYVMEGAPHAAHALAPQTPEARDANAYIARWFERHLAR
jgi:acetyl esterase/lipase